MIPCKACGEPLGKGGKHYHQRCIPKAQRIAAGAAGGAKAGMRARHRKLSTLLTLAPRRMTSRELAKLLHDAEMSGYNRALQMVARRRGEASSVRD